MQALRKQGVDARMVVFTKMTDSPYVDVVSTRFRRLARFTWERSHLFMHNGYSNENLYHLSDGSCGFKLWEHPWVTDADVLHLGWINQGLLSLNGLRKLAELGKPIMWTTYDMWAFTGICHINHGCKRYREQCGCCPMLNSNNPDDISHRVWLKKKKLYDETPIHFFTINKWMANLAHRSSLLRDKEITILPPAFQLRDFTTTPTDGYPAFDPIKSRRRILVQAPVLDDDSKNLPLTIEALNLIFDTHPEIANDTGVIFVGEIKNRALLDRLRFSWIYLGLITDIQLLRQLYASCEIVLSTASWELVGRSLIEGMAAGCVPVSIGGGAESDIINHPGNIGFVAKPTAESVAEQTLNALNTPHDREALRREALRRYDADNLVEGYIELYRNIRDNKPLKPIRQDKV